MTVRNTNTNFTRTTTTDSEGRYAIPELPLGPYQVTIKAGGFAAATEEAYVSLGSFGFHELPSCRCADHGDRASGTRTRPESNPPEPPASQF